MLSWRWSGRRAYTATMIPLCSPCSLWPSRVRGQGSLGLGGALWQKPRPQAGVPFTFFAVVGVGWGQREGSGSSSALHPHMPLASVLSTLSCPLSSLHFPTFYLTLLPSLSLSLFSLILSPALFLFFVCFVPILNACLLSWLLPWASSLCACWWLEGRSVVRRPENF